MIAMVFPSEWIGGRLYVYLPGDYPVFWAMAEGYYGA